MGSDTPKVLHDVLGIPLVEHVVHTALSAGVERIVLVVSPEHREQIAQALTRYEQVSLAVQDEPKGTAHAVLCGRSALEGFVGTALVLLGDAPCISPASLRTLLAAHAERQASLSILSGEVDEPRGYGRILRGPDGDPSAIVEEKDAPPHVLEVTEINSGVFALELPAMWHVLERIQPSPRTGEYYVTDALELARAGHETVIAVRAAAESDVLGVNTRSQLAQVIAVRRQQINEGHMENGVTIVDPATTFVDARATIERDVRIEPFCVISGPCHLETGAVVGPFAHVRGGSTIGPGARIGNFVEVVRSRIGANSRALHLAYLGDCQLGEDVNVGAGTVFANYDGERHHETVLESGVSLGSNTVIVAPCRLAAHSRTGAGAVVTGDEVPWGETWVGVPARPLHANTTDDAGGER